MCNYHSLLPLIDSKGLNNFLTLVYFSNQESLTIFSASIFEFISIINLCMASAIIPISKKTPQEELVEILISLNPDFATSSVVSSVIVDESRFLSSIIASLPELLNGEQAQIWERFTLIGYLFSSSPDFLNLITALENFSSIPPALTSLAFLYDLVTSQYSKFRIFKAIFHQSSKDPASSILIQPHLLKIEEFIKSWNELNTSELHDFMQELLGTSVSDPIKSILIVTLLSCEGHKEDVADKLVGKFFSTTEEYELDQIFALPGFKNVSGLVARLLELLATASAPEVISYLQGNEGVLKEKGFDGQKVLEICRVVGLIKLANGRRGLVSSRSLKDLVSGWMR